MLSLLVNTLYLGVGGFLGSVGRYLTTYWMGRIMGSTFPYGTMTVNLAGSFLIGFLMIILARPGFSHPGFRLFFIVGLMGGFTTYSSFSLENFKLMQEGKIGTMLLYTLVTYIPGLFLVWIGSLAGNELVKRLSESSH